MSEPEGRAVNAADAARIARAVYYLAENRHADEEAAQVILDAVLGTSHDHRHVARQADGTITATPMRQVRAGDHVALLSHRPPIVRVGPQRFPLWVDEVSS